MSRRENVTPPGRPHLRTPWTEALLLFLFIVVAGSGLLVWRHLRLQAAVRPPETAESAKADDFDRMSREQQDQVLSYLRRRIRGMELMLDGMRHSGRPLNLRKTKAPRQVKERMRRDLVENQRKLVDLKEQLADLEQRRR